MRKEQGVITIFMLIVLMVFIIFACVLVDLTRIKIFESSGKKVVEASFTSVLANYTKEMMEQYGLFSNYEDENTEELFSEYLEKNIDEEQKEGFLNLYDIRVENIEVTKVYTLNNNEVQRQQIYKYMKYRGPVNIAEFLSKLTEVSKYGNTAKLSKSKLNLDRKIGNISKKYADINMKLKEINDIRENTKESLNNYGGCLKEIIYASSDEEKVRLLNKKNKMHKKIIGNFEDMADIAQKIMIELGEVKNLTIGVKDSISEINDLIKSSKEKMLDSYVEKAESEINSIEEVINKGGKAELKSRLKNNLDIIKAGKTRFINNTKSKAESELRQIATSLEKCDLSLINFDDTEEVDMSYKDLDDRNTRAKNTEESLKKSETIEKVITDDLYRNLPSNSSPYEASNKVDFNEDTGENISDNAFDFASNLVFEITSDLINEIYINEYIISIFDNQVNHKERIGKKDQFFDYEVEYILNGCKKQSDNVTYANAKIFMMRFAINAMHVYTSEEKQKLSLGIATAVGSVSGGLGIPIIQNMILCSWAATESINDLKILLDGNTISLFKTGKSWSTNIVGLPKSKVIEEKEANINMSYDDYMRLLLLASDSTTKIDRIKNLLQLNLQTIMKDFKLEDCTVIYKVKVDFSINYMFMTESFMPSEYKKDGRHVCTVETYLGY
ncbi:MAG TPA: hypothetical protein DEP72_05860 [Clostridiales bacterium]|nr:MAG: hypothetical protein A2Y18_06335 [Clostridiales bacterium GWD2_32_19]HCC07667.1 hypothetical protein [Clostridiales bacterium]